MNPNETQMTPDESAASLSFANGLSEQMMPQASKDPKAQEKTQSDPEMDESMIDKKIDEKLKPIQDMLEQLLNEDGQGKA